VYGLQVQELGDASRAFESIGALAAELVRQMRSVQAAGPYDLLGYSFGGTVAYEMARLLEGVGEGSGLLMLIDSYPPGAIRPKTGFAKFRVHLREMVRNSPREMWAYVASRVARRTRRGGRSAPEHDPTLGRSLQARVADVERRCRLAADRYMPGPYGGPISMLRALRLSHWHFVDPGDPTCGWGRLAAGGVEVHEIDCEHLDVFTEPHISELGRLIHATCLAHDRCSRSAQTRP
jgi:thioesterase domain-containing protein